MYACLKTSGRKRGLALLRQDGRRPGHPHTRGPLLPAFEASFTPGHSGEFECHDGDKSAAKVHCPLLQPSQHRHWCIRPAPPPLPSSSCAFANRAPPSFRSWPGCLAHWKHFAVCAWPRANAFPESLAHFDVQACPNYDCTSRSAWSKNFPPLTSGRSSTSTSPPLASPTSATHNRTWMPTLTPIRSRTSA